MTTCFDNAITCNVHLQGNPHRAALVEKPANPNVTFSPPPPILTSVSGSPVSESRSDEIALEAPSQPADHSGSGRLLPPPYSFLAHRSSPKKTGDFSSVSRGRGERGPGWKVNQNSETSPRRALENSIAWWAVGSWVLSGGAWMGGGRDQRHYHLVIAGN